MFDKFLRTFAVDPLTSRGPGAWAGVLPDIHGWRELMDSHGGMSFGLGLYRLHSATSVASTLPATQQAFPELTDQFLLFGFDWLGRQFAIDLRGGRGHDSEVVMLEPGTGQLLAIPTSFADFHNSELTSFHREALASEFFQAWRDANPAQVPLAFDSCVGYRVPLFLGGGDDLDNLEVIDFDVYWTLAAQLLESVRDVAPGTTIRDVRGN